MLFHSIAFLVFFPTVVALYYMTPWRWRWLLLLAASYLFYGWWNVAYLGLIGLSTCIDYCAALGMDRSTSTKWRRGWLAVSICANLALLGVFKYARFFADSAFAISQWFGADVSPVTWQIILPVGISFYTFQSMSYTIDVYRGDRKPERHLGIFALYVAFFPQLVAGPIERSTRLLPQFRERRVFDIETAKSGLRLMLWGYFLKLAIADRLAPYVDTVYGNPAAYNGWPQIIATYFFAFQIFCDFAGYSYIAIGAARIMGYSLMENFRRPFLTQSVSQFWREWHISFSTWFRDYVYVPLGGNRVTAGRRYANLFAVFALSGLWHGARWTVVIWGALHGMYVVIETALGLGGRRSPLKSMSERCVHWVRVLLTFHLVWLSWVLFRSEELGQALSIYRGMLTIFEPGDIDFIVSGTPVHFVINLALIGALMLLQVAQGDRPFDAFFDSLKKPFRWALCLALIFVTLTFGTYQESPFIYFQF